MPSDAPLPMNVQLFVVAACQDPEVSRYSPVNPFPYTEADAVGCFESQEPTRLASDGLDFAVVHARSGDRLGAIGVKIKQLLRSAEVGYWLAREARRHGCVTSAVRAVARWVFDASACAPGSLGGRSGS